MHRPGRTTTGSNLPPEEKKNSSSPRRRVGNTLTGNGQAKKCGTRTTRSPLHILVNALSLLATVCLLGSFYHVLAIMSHHDRVLQQTQGGGGTGGGLVTSTVHLRPSYIQPESSPVIQPKPHHVRQIIPAIIPQDHHPQHQQSNSNLNNNMNNTRISSTATSACLLYMDDNHWLVEWLAYHYTTLNLGHVIMAIDGRSKTSPMPILDRWQGKISVELWNDTHYFPSPPASAKTLQEVNLARQQAFIPQCLRVLKQQGASWVMVTDADEYITINPRTRTMQSPEQRESRLLYRPHAPPLNQPDSIRQFIEEEYQRQETVCYSMGRLQFSPDEVSLADVQRDVTTILPWLNASHLMTLRWQHPADDLVGPKNLVDLRHIDEAVLPYNWTHQHRVIPQVCGEAGHTWHRKNSILQVYHYLGTLQQFTFRDDARNTLASAGRNKRFDRYKGQSLGQTDDLRPWLNAFLIKVGDATEAQRLLQGVGRVEGWPSAQAHNHRFVDPAIVKAMLSRKKNGDDAVDDDKDDDKEDITSNASEEDNKDKSVSEDENNDDKLDDDVVQKEHDAKAESLMYTDQKDNVLSKSTAFYSIARKDRSGAVMADMLLAHAYGFAHNKTYAGACIREEIEHQASTESLIETVGLEKVLFFACPSDASKTPVLDRSIYGARNTNIWTAEYVQHLRSLVRYPEHRQGGAVVHIRRGDVTLCGPYSNRYLPNAHYMSLLHTYVPSHVPVTILSESASDESFDDFVNATVLLDTSLSEAWKLLLTADYVILSKSSFSMVPAVLNPTAHVIYTPFSQRPLPSWISVSDERMELTQERIQQLQNERPHCVDVEAE